MQKEDLAIKCFQENRTLFCNHETNPERYNLYVGLESMSHVLKELMAKIDSLEHEVLILRRELTPNSSEHPR